MLSIPNPPINTIKDLNTMFFNFIWKGKDCVSRNQMVQDYSQGGVRMVDVALYMESLKVTWIRRLLVTKCSGWAALAHVILNISNLGLLLIRGWAFKDRWCP